MTPPLRRGQQFYVGPLRILVAMNVEGKCEVHIVYHEVLGSIGVRLGSGFDVPEEALIQLRDLYAEKE